MLELMVTTGEELVRIRQQNDHWLASTIPSGRGMQCVTADPRCPDVLGAVYAGTEPSRLFVSPDEGRSWRELTALQDIPSRPDWRFPPRPWTSPVRAIAPNPHDARLLLVGIELDGVMRSEDGGETGARRGRRRASRPWLND